MKKLLGALACKYGWHAWEKDPSQKDIVKGTGVHLAFWSEALQKATRHCTRHGCKCSQKVYRHGLCGPGGSGSRWKRLRLAKEKQIDSLPNVFHA